MQAVGRRFVRHLLPIAGTALVWALLAAKVYRDQKAAAPAAAEASARPQPAAPLGPPSPAETAMLLHSLHQRRDYDGIAELVVADRRKQTTGFLSAVDRVITANAEIHETARQKYGDSLSGIWDIASMADNLGLFSAHVVLINQRFKGDKAVVTLQEGDHVPLVRAEFQQAGGRWLYRPEAIPAQAIAELEELARVLNSLNECIQGGKPFEYYDDAFVQRVLPQMNRVAMAGDEPPHALAAGGEDQAP